MPVSVEPSLATASLGVGQRAPHFLVTRLSHIGDCVLTLPLIAALRRHWPTCRITWAMESPSPKLLGQHPEIDQVVTIPKGYLKRPRQVWQLRQQLRAAKIDVAIDPQSLTKSSMLGWLSGADQRWGFGGRYGRELSPWLNNRLFVPAASCSHLADRSLALVQDMIQRLSTSPSLAPTRRSGNAGPAAIGHFPEHLPIPPETARWLAEAQDRGEVPQRYVVLNPGASWPSKRWQNERWAEVARQLASDGWPVVVTWAGAEEQIWAEQIAADAGMGVEMAPPTTLLQLAALCRGGQCFIGCDTGPMHIAAAVGTPCVVLFGPTLPQNSGPYGAGHVCLQAWHQTIPPGQKQRVENLAMRDITAQQVIDGCQTLLDRSAANHGIAVS
jgi:heptosyltransferase I